MRSQLHIEPAQSTTLQTTPWDRYSSFLIAGIALTGMLTSLLLLLFFLKIEWKHPQFAMINVLPPFETPNLNDAKFDEDFEEIEVPPTPGDADLNNFKEAVTDAISNTPALAPLLEQEVEGEFGTDPRKTRTKGIDDGDGPRGQSSKHWKIQFTLQSEQEYLEQIDTLGIELGLLDKFGPQVEYAKSVSSAPQFRVDIRKNESRFFFYANSAKIAHWNANVFRKGGIDPTNKISLRFFPKELVAKMMAMEKTACIEQELDPNQDLQRTVFGLVQVDGIWVVKLLRIVPL